MASCGIDTQLQAPGVAESTHDCPDNSAVDGSSTFVAERHMARFGGKEMAR